MTVLRKTECVLYGGNNGKDTGDQNGLAGYSLLPLNVLEHTFVTYLQ